jgi:tetratricopeptide (TPR) repeat protein
VTARCYAGAGRLAFAPLAAWLQSEALAPTLQTLDASSVREIARLRPELLAARPDVAAPDRELESWQRTRFFGALAQAFRSAAPLVLVLDDLQWADGDTLDWFDYFLRSGPGARCLFLGTARAEEEPDNPFLSRLLAQLEAHSLLTTITLGALDPEATGHLASQIAGRALDEAARTRVFSETEGHPLFIVERGRMELFGPGDRPSADARGPRVESVMAARLALLSADARAVAETAAVIGRDFTFEILACASDLEEAALVPALDELWRRHVVRAQGPEGWDFTHDRIREVAYATLGPARRRLVHRRVSQALELLHAHDLDRVSAAIALHLERGGQPARAVPFLDRAAAVAMRLSAGEEAIRCLTHALSLLARQPAGRDRDERELGLRSTLAGAFNSGRGYSSVEAEENLNRVLEVYGSDRRDEIPVRWLSVAWAVQFVLGNLIRSRELAERALAQSVRDPASRCEAHHAMGGTFLGIGELAAARRHFDAALAAYDRQHPPRSALGPDLGVFAQAWNAHALWLLGDGDASMASAEDAIALARRLEHPYSQALAFAYAALLHQLRGAVDEVARYASEATALCERYQFAYYVDWAHVLLGWAIGRERPAAGRAAIERAVQGLDARRALARRPYFLSLLAETLLLEGIGDRAASILDQAIALALDRAETWWLPALYLQKSALEPSPLRDETLRRGLDLARSQNSRALERRILAASSVQPT